MVGLQATIDITEVIGKFPYRMAFAGGWIDQPFVSKRNPDPPGSMVVIQLEPEFHFMERSGMGTSTRRIATELWNGALPDGDPAELVHELYKAENEGKTDPAGSQDMAGLGKPNLVNVPIRLILRRCDLVKRCMPWHDHFLARE